MVIIKKDVETKEIEIPGFRKILRNPKHPDYKELRIYIKNGWTPIDPEDDEKEIQKAKKRKQVLKENKARRPKYIEMEKKIKKLGEKIDTKKMLEEFNELIKIKNNYKNVLKWYNEQIENIPEETKATPSKTEKDQKSNAK